MSTTNTQHQPSDAALDWIRLRNGKPAGSSYHNAMLALSTLYPDCWRLDNRHGVPEWNPDGMGWRLVNDADLRNMRHEVECRFSYPPLSYYPAENALVAAVRLLCGQVDGRQEPDR